MAQESVVQVAPDSTGKKIRNIQLDVVQPDGSIASVQMQVVVVADQNGNLTALSQVQGFALLPTSDQQLLEQVTQMNDKLGKMLEMLALEFEQSTEDFDGQD
jgi:ribonuclease PH